jgi:hypothetical protein
VAAIAASSSTKSAVPSRASSIGAFGRLKRVEPRRQNRGARRLRDGDAVTGGR